MAVVAPYNGRSPLSIMFEGDRVLAETISQGLKVPVSIQKGSRELEHEARATQLGQSLFGPSTIDVLVQIERVRDTTLMVIVGANSRR